MPSERSPTRYSRWYTAFVAVTLFCALSASLLSYQPAAADPAAASDSSDSSAHGSLTVHTTLLLLRGVKDYPLADSFLVPGSMGVFHRGNRLREGPDYHTEFAAGTLHLHFEPDREETLTVRYRHYPVSIPTRYRPSVEIVDRTGSDGQETKTASSRRYHKERSRSPSASLFSISGAKGFSVGRRNGGEFSMDQSLDLAVDGMLPGGTEVELQLSDQSIPLSVTGSSMELRELDQVSFRVTNGPASATLGDYHYSIDRFEFARMERKLEGVRGEWVGDGLSVSGAGAVSPGRYTSNRLYGVDGKQGPYRLTVNGVEVGTGFVVLAGTERVYLDGERMERGENRDYTIDYNSGTVTFTSRRMIGDDSRIEIDFEYTERGKGGSLYAATFQSDKGRLPIGMRGYLLREVEAADSAVAVGTLSGGGASDRFGFAYDYEPGLGLRFEGEGAYQSGAPGTDPGSTVARPAGAFWLKGGVADVSLFDRSGKSDRWRLSWFEKRIQDEFTYPGRRNGPDFQWNWGLNPEEEGRETWRVFELGFDLRENLDLGFEIGRIERGNGEYAVRRKLGGSLSDDDSKFEIEGELFSIRSMRYDPAAIVRSLRDTDASGHAITVRRKWSKWTPAFAYESRKELIRGESGGGERYTEFEPSVQGFLSENVRTRFGLRLKREEKLNPAEGSWTDDSRLIQGRSEIEYGGGSGPRIRGSTEFRRKWDLGGSGGDLTTILGRGEFLTAGWDRTYSTSTIYELNSTSSLLQRVTFVPERDDEGEYLEDGTYVGPGNGTHNRETAPDSEGDGGPVLGASLTSVQNVDLSRLIEGRDWPLVSFSHTSTVSLRNERIGDNRWRVYLFLPPCSGSDSSDLYESIQYRSEFEGIWGKEYSWMTTLDVEYLSQLDRRFSNFDQEFMQRKIRFRVGGTLENGVDIESSVSTKRRVDKGSSSQPTDLREQRIEWELGYRTSRQVRYFVETALGTNRDRLSGTKLGDGSIGPGLDLFLGGGGNLNLQYRVENVWSDDPVGTIPIVMLSGRDIGTSHHYQVRSNWRLAGSLDFTISLTGRKRPGKERIENSGRTDFTYRF